MSTRYVVIQVTSMYSIYDTLQDRVLEERIHSKASAEQRILDIGQEYYE